MDIAYASGSLSVKVAELKKVESQLANLGNNTNEEVVTFLNHLQLAGTVEISNFATLINQSEKVLFNQLVAILSDDYYYLLDLVYADEIITFLNLKLNDVKFEDKFKEFDYLHLPLAKLLEGNLIGMQDHYAAIMNATRSEFKTKGYKQEAILSKVYYQFLTDKVGDNLYLDSKITMINLRTLYRAKKLDLTIEEFELELIGSYIEKEKFVSFYRLDNKQIISSLKDRVDHAASATYELITSNYVNIDKYLDAYLAEKVKNLVFSIEFSELFIIYAFQFRQLIKTLKKIYNRVEEYETNRNN